MARPFSFSESPGYQELVNFLVEQAENANSPLQIQKISDEFKEKIGSTETDRCWVQRINKIRVKIADMHGIDLDTKVKMLFALSAPIDHYFLLQLKDQADVKVDSRQRIIYYSKNGGGLELIGNHPKGHSELNERDGRVLEFLALQSKICNSPFSYATFIANFKKENGDFSYSITRYGFIKKKIYTLTEFDKVTKVRMMFVSSTELHDDVLQELRKEAVVEVDSMNRITKYIANDGSLELKGSHCSYRKRKSTSSVFFDEEMNKFGKRLNSLPIELNDIKIEPEENESSSYKLMKILETLRTVALSFRLPDICTMIDVHIEKEKDSDKEISLKETRIAFETFAVVLKRNATMKPDEESICLNSFIPGFISTIIIAGLPVSDSLEDLQNALVDSKTQYVPTKNLQKSLTLALDIVAF